MLRAARALAERAPGLRLGRFRLIKTLPVAAGLGGGSSDAAAALRALADANGMESDDFRLWEAARATGADVSVCLDPRARVMAGIGDRIGPALGMAPLPAVLVNPAVAIATPRVFAGLGLARGAASGTARRLIRAPARIRLGCRAAPGSKRSASERRSDRARDIGCARGARGRAGRSSRAHVRFGRDLLRALRRSRRSGARGAGGQGRAAGLVGAGDLSSLVARVAGFDGVGGHPSGIGRALSIRATQASARPRRPLALTRRSRARSPPRCPAPPRCTSRRAHSVPGSAPTGATPSMRAARRRRREDGPPRWRRRWD